MRYIINRYIGVSFIGLLLLLMLIGCEREYTFRGDETGVLVSEDTIRFDTIFTSIGSSTKHFKIYNPSTQDMVIEAIELAGGENSSYRLNIDGVPADFVTDVRLRARDSLFVFVDVMINPSGENSPFVVNDSIIIYTRERVQNVQLLAFGQDVVRLGKESIKTQTFTNEKPYLVTDCVEVDSLNTLTVEAGTKFFFVKDACLIVYGTLLVNGTIDEPVLFSGVRLEKWYKDKPGQWGYIHLMPGSGETEINYAHIRNGKAGVVIDSTGLGDKLPVKIYNTKIEHISGHGIVAQSSGVEVANSVISNCGKSLAALTVGGRYEFTHCTMANYYSWNFRTSPSLLISNYYHDKNNKPVIVDLEKAVFKNCIIYGRNENELYIDIKKVDEQVGVANVLFSNCMVKVADSFKSDDGDIFQNTIRNKDPRFVKIDEYNFQLDTLSPAKDAANIAYSATWPSDILGKSRLEDMASDIGAYERIEKK